MSHETGELQLASLASVGLSQLALDTSDADEAVNLAREADRLMPLWFTADHAVVLEFIAIIGVEYDLCDAFADFETAIRSLDSLAAQRGVEQCWA